MFYEKSPPPALSAGASKSRRPRLPFLSQMIAATCAGVVMFTAPLSAAEVSPDTKLVTRNAACADIGTIWWNELLAPETEELSKFYANVVGWKRKVVDVEEQKPPASSANDRYTIFMSGNREVAGLMNENHPDAIHPRSVGWFIYIQVEDVDAAAQKAEDEGGTILQEPVEIANNNRVAVVSDPSGNIFGLVTPAHKGNCE